MSQYDFGTINPSTKDGTALATDLNAWRTALHSGHVGSSRPSYAVAGMTWINNATNPWAVYVFDGTDDIQVGSVDTSTNLFTPKLASLSGLIKAATGTPSAASANVDYASPNNVQVQSATRFTSGGTANAMTGTLSPAIVGYVAGLRVTCTPVGANTVTGPTLNLNSLGVKTIKKRDAGGTKVALTAGDYNSSGPFNFEYDGTDLILLDPVLQTTQIDAIKSITCTQTGGALTFTLNPCVLDFRSTTLTTGVPVTRTVSAPITLTVPSGGTLGSATTIAANLIPVAIDNAGTVELAVINIAGGNDLSESGIINTTAISAASTANNVFYSTTARTGVAYRVVGSVTAVNTAGAWGNPTLVQGYGGQALAAMSSLGYGQTLNDVAASRAQGTTYYNTTGRPIIVSIALSGSSIVGARFIIRKNGADYVYSSESATVANTSSAYCVIQPGDSYATFASAGTYSNILFWREVR